MSKARLSGPPPIEPLAIPADDFHRKMTVVTGEDVQNAGQEPVSPLSPRSKVMSLQSLNSVRRISPLSSPVMAQSDNRGWQQPPKQSQPSQRRVQPSPRESFPPAHIRNVPPRKPVNDRRPPREGLVVAQIPVVIGSQPHHSVRPEHVHSSRPRSQSFQAVPDTFLQDYTPPAPAAPAASIRSRPSRSQSVSPNSSRQEQLAFDRRTCAHCGKAQKNCPANFLCCKTCRGVYYCSIPCWEGRVCHRSIKCTVCDCTQASSSPDFSRCQKCRKVGREFWYCSDECWDQRNCHVRSDQSAQQPPKPPPKTRQAAQRPLLDDSSNHRNGPRYYDESDRRLQRSRVDLEAQGKSQKNRTPYSQRTGWSATVWICMIVFILLCIFVPIVAVFAGRGHVN